MAHPCHAALHSAAIGQITTGAKMGGENDQSALAVRLMVGLLKGTWGEQLDSQGARAADTLCRSVAERLRRSKSTGTILDSFYESVDDPRRQDEVRTAIDQVLSSDPDFSTYLTQLASHVPASLIESLDGEQQEAETATAGQAGGASSSVIGISQSKISRSDIAGRDINKNRRISIGTGGIGIAALLLLGGGGYAVYHQATSSDSGLDIHGKALKLVGRTWSLPLTDQCFEIWGSHYHNFDVAGGQLLYVYYAFKSDGTIDETSQFRGQAPGKTDHAKFNSSPDGSVLYVTWATFYPSNTVVTPVIQNVDASSFTVTLSDTSNQIVATCKLTFIVGTPD